MASFLDHVGQRFYESLIEGNKPLQEFTLLDAWGYLIEVARDDKRVAVCVIKIERKGECYQISQLMVNKRGEPLYANGEFVVGHVWRSYDLDDSMYEIAKMNRASKMALEVLRLKENRMEVKEDE